MESGIIKVVAAIINLDGQYLIARRKEDKKNGGLWEFPGGKIEPGESPEDALAREIKEELNVDIEVGEFFDADIHRYEQATIELAAYSASLLSYDFRLADHDELRWVALPDFGEYQFSEADHFLIEEIRRLAASG